MKMTRGKGGNSPFPPIRLPKKVTPPFLPSKDPKGNPVQPVKPKPNPNSK
jgi:hypothetical protein